MKTTEVAPGVFRFKVYSRPNALAFLEECGDFVISDGKPNSMNKYGKVLGPRANDWLHEMQERLVSPIARKHFTEIRRLKKYPYAFTVEYDVKKQRSLAAHFDSSSVTLNICLAGDFTGGGVMFYGPGKQRHVVENVVGYGIVHRGDHVHRATKLTSGTRTNIIFWCQERAR